MNNNNPSLAAMNIQYVITGPKEDIEKVKAAYESIGVERPVLASLYTSLNIYQCLEEEYKRAIQEETIKTFQASVDRIDISTQIMPDDVEPDCFRELKRFMPSLCIYYLSTAFLRNGKIVLRCLSNDFDRRFFSARYAYLRGAPAGRLFSLADTKEDIMEAVGDNGLGMDYDEYATLFEGGEYIYKDENRAAYDALTEVWLREKDKDLTTVGMPDEHRSNNRHLIKLKMAGGCHWIEQYCFTSLRLDVFNSILFAEKEVTYDDLIDYVDADILQLMDSVNELRQMRFIKPCGEGFTIDGPALINRMDKIGVLSKRKEEKKGPAQSFTTLEDVMTGWETLPLEGFEQCLRKSSGIPFADGYFALGIDKLDEGEKRMLMMLTHDFYNKKGEEIQDDSDDDEREKAHMNALIGQGFITSFEVMGETDAAYTITYLSEKLLAALFPGREDLTNHKLLARRCQIIRPSSIKQKELFYDPKNEDQVETIRSIVTPDRYNEITGILEEKGFGAGILALLYGAPGTGKTELILQIARETGRNIMMVDVSRITGSLWGSSEKNTREIFWAYRVMKALSKETPILVFNEADGLLGKRLTVERTVDKSENAVQSILLQELENFEGILFATTNLTLNLDKAYNRRFLFKFGFVVPSPETRAKIWKSNISELTEEMAMALAKDYDFTGGEISNVAKKCVVYYALHHRKLPSLETIRSYCSSEKLVNNDNRVRIKGFGS